MGTTRIRTTEAAECPESDASTPILDSVLHPSDFSKGSLTAFHHALKAALVARSSFTILHVAPATATPWTDIPGVRETLERWGLLPPGSPRSALPQLGIDVRKVVARQMNPVKSVVTYLKTHPADLIVLATHPHKGRTGWLRQSVAEPIARRSGQLTLFLPEGAPGFVSGKDGSLRLEKILIPVTANPRSQLALDAAVRLVRRLQCPRGIFAVLHVGAAVEMPVLKRPMVPGWQWKQLTRTGDVTHGIVDTAGKQAANLIVMCTSGRYGFLDALRGSQSEQVLRSGRYPLLTIPESSLAARALAETP
jgi:nucleotide-binding universal stress UspA family protein